jgi:hypothetical protein
MKTSRFRIATPIDFSLSAAAARSDVAPAPWRRPFLTWLDGIEAGWAVPLLLVGLVAVWMAFLIIAYWSGDPHPDVLEAWSVGRTWAWGHAKHPPLMGWVAHLWTAVFPLTNWSMQLLAMVNSALALWLVDLISRRFVRGDKRIILLLLLMLTPAYQFHAQRFNANTVLLATWPLATWCFLRSFESRSLLWAVAAGATAALAVLGKYYSVFLIGGFAFAAIVHPWRRIYFGSLALWISTAAGLVVLAPHLHWLVTAGAPPLKYALEVHGGASFAESLVESASFLLGLAASLSLPAIVWVIIAAYRLRQFPADWRALEPGLRLLLLIGAGTVIFPIIVAGYLGSDLPSVWALQGLFLFVVPVVCGARFSVERFYSVNLTVIVLGVAALAVLVAAPLHAIYRNTHPFNEGRNFYRLSAIELMRQWHELSAHPLPLISGDEALAFAVPFYSADHPAYKRAWDPPDTPLPAILKNGWAAICFSDDKGCIAFLDRNTPQVRFVRSEFSVQSSLLGAPGAKRNVTALMLPPGD